MANEKSFVGCDFNAVLARRCGKRGKLFRLFALPNGLDYGRFGQTVAKKICPKAVSRNYMKRVTRQLFRKHASDLMGLDVVLMHQTPFTSFTYNDVALEFEYLVKAIQSCRDLSSI
ncbi:ribonuclease P protein component [Ferrovum sp. PN-J185]|uniref:ribonuclease P protein component n=1 Tax=Ferrovum sp. PN-J185 TaxID=1356306 RepID=UPI00079387A5|nr:ribonuclease P protein component [Ferrovum sp. PN-J185]KXW55919.1 ribonuclease P protein component [Ferrovum sp. PN-J185]MCC6068691.1 ribonuclease P protein component [Ferrovum sp. PN-J185]MDE1891904.1 ribonuclease P protein component [Betaproteobacteria bacterium]